MNREINLEKVRLLAENYIEKSKELKSIRKELKEELVKIDFKLDEKLSNGRLIWSKTEPKKSVNKNLVLSYLYDTISQYNQDKNKFPIPTMVEVEDDIKNQCMVEKEENWTLEFIKS